MQHAAIRGEMQAAPMGLGTVASSRHAMRLPAVNRVRVAVEMALERTDGKVPERLNEALSYAVARIEQNPENVKTIVSRLGWDGRQSEAEPDRPLGNAPKHEMELVGRAIDRLRENGFVPDAVERAIA